MPAKLPQPAPVPIASPGDRPSLAREHRQDDPAMVIVGIGTSAGGLDAARRLLDVLPTPNPMAFILVQHLDPTHASMMVNLLASHTHMAVIEAIDGMEIVANHVYVIPPGRYLSVEAGLLHLTLPTVPHGTRLPLDFLLTSMARDYGARAVCIILSGTGSDGSLGAGAIKAGGGLVIAQDPNETGYDGMSRSAMATGSVDLVLSIADIPSALARYRPGATAPLSAHTSGDKAGPIDWLNQIIDLIRIKTAHDFRLYKLGTLQRRIERRMALAAMKPGEGKAYLEKLKSDPAELEVLATDLLINVTSFFRDKFVFDLLADKIVPGILSARADDQPVRLWVAGCSSGEEAYSLAMVFREQMSLLTPGLKLQIFASDVDADAIGTAREGLYPASIAEDVSADRLARFFQMEEGSYRILPELRASIVFTVQDLLADPPFSRLDMISCRNMLIYLGLTAQAKALGLFHFALNKGGTLLLGTSETIGEANDLFEVIDKSARLYRHIGQRSHLNIGTTPGTSDSSRQAARTPPNQLPQRLPAIGDLARQRVLDAFGPATVLVNKKNACVFTLGAVNSHLSVPPGYPTQDLFAMTEPALHPKLRMAMQRAADEATRVTVPAGQFDRGGDGWNLALSAEPIASDGDRLTLISFIETRQEDSRPRSDGTRRDGDSNVQDLAQELETARMDLADAVRNLRVSGEEQKTINEEAMSVNEEYQSTNEELLASKEELQSVNEELTALNVQLQETLDRQRTTSNDLQNVLYSTDVATLFLDTNLRIRFFTPSTKSLFNVIPTDVGRPLADLHALAIDETFLADAIAVLANHVPIEREVMAHAGAWYMRRILPYKTHTDAVEGVVVTFTDVSERRRIADALEAAKRRAQQADAAKSRFLAAASHDLRQPLQTLALLQGLLAQTVEGEKATRLVTRLDDTLGSMTAMLNTLLDINQIEAGTVSAEIVQFPVGTLLTRLRDEFSYVAESQGLSFRVLDSSLDIMSDPRLIEQMIRNILSNALKYTKTGKILLGCRRGTGHIRIEVWDTGLGIPETELQSIFEEYHQIGNAARDRANGLGLGLAIVKRLGDLLGHTVRVRSKLGLGSVFSIEIETPDIINRAGAFPRSRTSTAASPQVDVQTGTILVVEDGADIRGLLEALLTADGYRVATAADGIEAIDMITRNLVRPDLILADFNLPNGMNGLQIAAKARHILHRHLPVIILSGDISAATLANIAADDCVQLAKPVKLSEMRQAVRHQLIAGRNARERMPKGAASRGTVSKTPVIYIVDDDAALRLGLRELLQAEGRTVEDFESCEAFIAAFQPGREACLLIDATLPGMSGLDLLHVLKDAGHHLPAIMITGHGDVAIAVEAMKAGASDFIEKPVGVKGLLEAVGRALLLAQDGQQRIASHEAAVLQLAGLTPRQHQIMDMILAGHPNKNIAADLGISQRTVENHRAAIMKRTGSTSLPDLARTAISAQDDGGQ